MRYSSTTTAIVLAAMGIGEALAGPHLHRHAHVKKDVDWDSLDWDSMGVDWAAAYAAGQASKSAAAAAATPTEGPAVFAAVSPSSSPSPSTTPAPTSTTAAVPTTAAAAPTSSSAASSVLAALWNGLEGCSNGLTSFGGSSGASGSAGDSYVGNYGSPYGSNIIKVGSAAGYPYTNTFVNTQSKAITVNIWNKVGPDFQPLSGSALAPKSTTLTFVLAPGASQVVAFAENSQVSWAEACSNFAASGAFATSWGEANFVSTGCGYDMSAIMNSGGNNYNMAISSLETPCISDMTQNYWLTATQPIGGSDGSCYIPGGKATLTTKMGGHV